MTLIDTTCSELWQILRTLNYHAKSHIHSFSCDTTLYFVGLQLVCLSLILE